MQFFKHKKFASLSSLIQETCFFSNPFVTAAKAVWIFLDHNAQDNVHFWTPKKFLHQNLQRDSFLSRPQRWDLACRSTGSVVAKGPSPSKNKQKSNHVLLLLEEVLVELLEVLGGAQVRGQGGRKKRLGAVTKTCKRRFCTYASQKTFSQPKTGPPTSGMSDAFSCCSLKSFRWSIFRSFLCGAVGWRFGGFPFF